MKGHIYRGATYGEEDDDYESDKIIEFPGPLTGTDEPFTIQVDLKVFHLIRHAIAIDERRAKKRQRRIAKRGQKR